jgi:hypothetical protein
MSALAMDTMRRGGWGVTQKTRQNYAQTSENLRTMALDLASQVAPKPAKKARPWLSAFTVSRSRTEGSPFLQLLYYMTAVGPEGAMKIATFFLGYAQSMTAEADVCLHEMANKGLHTNQQQDRVRLAFVKGQATLSEFARAAEDDIATDLVKLAAARRAEMEGV